MNLPFTPSNSNAPPWQAQFSVNGNPYIVSAFWNIFGQRWYIQLSSYSGQVLMFQPLVESPLTYDIPLFPGVLDGVIYRAGNVVVP